MAKPDFRSTVAEEMIRQIEAGTARWQKPWQANVIRMAPYNPTTDKSYKGINAWWLDLMGRGDPRWMTYKQATSLDAQVRAGEKGTPIEYWQWSERSPQLDLDGKPVYDEDGRQKYVNVRLERPRVFFAVVFNAEQMDGLEPLKVPEPSFDPVERAEAILQGGTVPINHDQADRAFYRPSSDSIHLPLKAAFDGAYEYYATALHELGHATGHESRFGREFGPFGSEKYAIEELRAEMASYMITTELGLGHYPERHAGYVESWMRAITNDRNALFRAARDAELIRTWVLEPDLRQELVRKEPEKETSPTLGTEEEKAMSASKTTRIYLNVPFAEKDQAKAAGAKWDKAKQSWFAPEGADMANLGRWQANDVEPVKAQEAVTEKGPRQFLNVPYEERNLAKAAGAKWDRRAKSWYAPDGANPEHLSRWKVADGINPPSKPVISPEDEFAAELQKQGLVLKGRPVMDGEWHRVPVDSDRKGQKSGSYRGFLDGHPNGQIMIFRTGDKPVHWVATGIEHDPRELERQRSIALARKQSRDLERENGYRQTAKRAYGIWANAEVAKDHPYLQKKAVPALDLKKDATGNLLVPVRDKDGFIWNLQKISPEGEKRFLTDGRKSGLMHAIDPDGRIGRGGTVIVAEGYSTAASLHAATRLPVVVAFDAGNLRAVAEALKEKDPSADLVIAADDDHKNERNTGLVKAEEAAKAVGGLVMQPALDLGEKAKGMTDFNDIMLSRGIEGLKASLPKDLSLHKARSLGHAKVPEKRPEHQLSL